MKVVFLTSPGAPEFQVERRMYRDAALASWHQVDKQGVEFEILEDTTGQIQRAGYVAMELALQGHDFGIVAFDDVTVAPDVLDYFHWAERAVRNVPPVGSITAMQLGTKKACIDQFYEVRMRQQFTCGCYGTWQRTWDEYFKPDYDFDYARNGFDNDVNDRVFPENGLVQVYPTYARSQNIGAVGVHMRARMLSEHLALPDAATERPDRRVRSWYLREDPA